MIFGLIAYFTDHDYIHVAKVAGVVAFFAILAYGLLLIAVYVVVNYFGFLLLVAIIAALTIAGLHELGVVPKFW